MRPHPASPAMNWMIGSLSVLTLVMKIPQVWTIWVSEQAAGVSIWSWSAYWVSAAVWFRVRAQEG